MSINFTGIRITDSCLHHPNFIFACLMKSKIKSLLLLLIMFLILELILRKAGIGFTGVFINLLTIGLCIFVLFKSLIIPEFINRVILILFLITAMGFLQYYIPLFSGTIWIFTGWILFSFFVFHVLRKKIAGKLLWTLITFILLTTLILNPRKFHNFYRPNCYEEYIRSRYTSTNGLVADYFIDKYKEKDTLKSQHYLTEAKALEAFGEYQKALTNFNKALDLNPDNSRAYHERGFLKLTYLDIDADVAYSAIKDFSRAIRLDSTYTIAYFHRALAYGYLKRKSQSFLDTKIVWETDSILSEDEFRIKYGMSKKSFSIPFHS